MKFFDNGRELEFSGEYRYPRSGELYLDSQGGVATNGDVEMYEVVRAIVTPVHKTYVFGPIEFKETGEVRVPKHEYYVDKYGVAFADGSNLLYGEYPIVFPTRIIEL